MIDQIGMVLLAAGSGQRMGGENKMLRRIAGMSVLERSFCALRAVERVSQMIVVVSPQTKEEAERCIRAYGEEERCRIVWGGASRGESVYNGLFDPFLDSMAYIGVHDGARCLVSGDVVEACIASVLRYGSGVAGIPAVDTMKRVDENQDICENLTRQGLWQIQTPQMFRADWLKEAYLYGKRKGFPATDDAQLVSDIGHSVHMVQSVPENMKITNEWDLKMADRIVWEYSEKKRHKIGLGEDVHAFTEDKTSLILAGVSIPFDRGLKGHSDADVLAHAVTDALLGAMAWGDIGQWFPDTDIAYKNADSMSLLKRVVVRMMECGQEIEHVDAVIVAQKPKMMPYILQMRQKLAAVMQVDLACISVKATTTEGLGWEGKGLGITARAVALVYGVTVTEGRER